MCADDRQRAGPALIWLYRAKRCAVKPATSCSVRQWLRLLGYSRPAAARWSPRAAACCALAILSSQLPCRLARSYRSAARWRLLTGGVRQPTPALWRAEFWARSSAPVSSPARSLSAGPCPGCRATSQAASHRQLRFMGYLAFCAAPLQPASTRTCDNCMVHCRDLNSRREAACRGGA